VGGELFEDGHGLDYLAGNACEEVQAVYQALDVYCALLVC
jgi:hypothetical protein